MVTKYQGTQKHIITLQILAMLTVELELCHCGQLSFRGLNIFFSSQTDATINHKQPVHENGKKSIQMCIHFLVWEEAGVWRLNGEGKLCVDRQSRTNGTGSAFEMICIVVSDAYVFVT